MSVDITDHYFKYGEVKYFRDDAQVIQLCSFGETKDPVGPKARLAVQGHVANEHLVGRVQTVPPVHIDWAAQSRADVEVNGQIHYFTVGASGSKSAGYEDARAADLKLVQLFVNEGPLTNMLNDEAGAARRFLADEGKDARIVSTVWIATDATLAEAFASTASGSGSLEVKTTSGVDLQVTVNGSSSASGQTTIVLGPGTTFAFGMHKVKRWTNNDRTRIEDMEDDYKGMG